MAWLPRVWMVLVLILGLSGLKPLAPMPRNERKTRNGARITIGSQACERHWGTPSSRKNKPMSEPFSELPKQPSQRSMSNASVYSAHIQEAMRYDKLRSEDYHLVMTLLHAVLQGYTEAQWQDEQQRPLQVLRQRPPVKGSVHADAANRYEQTVRRLKDLRLWPW